jgi:hypothetical protein
MTKPIANRPIKARSYIDLRRSEVTPMSIVPLSWLRSFDPPEAHQALLLAGFMTKRRVFMYLYSVSIRRTVPADILMRTLEVSKVRRVKLDFVLLFDLGEWTEGDL